MKIYIQVDNRQAQDGFFQIEWPDEWRLPVAGEVVLIGPRQLTVAAVQWEFDQGGDAPSVQVRCLEFR